MTKNRHRRRTRNHDRGSALLVSLMVIVGLSLLGLGFVAISEVESKIAKNEAQALQTMAIAEAGAKMAVEWFQDPLWGMANAGMPANGTCASFGVTPCSPVGTPGTFMKTVRTVGTYVGVYKPIAGSNLLDKPYRPGNDDRLFGDEADADIIINRTTVGSTGMDAINNILLGTAVSDRQAGEITDIRIYAPPMVGATLTNGFWVGGTRYGVATIKVTAQQFLDPATRTNVVATHSVRIVVGELPLPIPAGPIQGNASVSFGGDFFVHWGMETSRTTLDPSRYLKSLPWQNAYERPHFEHGYEPGTGVGHVSVTAGGSGYTGTSQPVTFPCVVPGCVVTTQATGHAVINGGSVQQIIVDTPGTGYSRDPWKAPTPTICPGGCGGTGAAGLAAIGHEAYFITGSSGDTQNFFRELLNKSFDDPWYGARAAGDNLRDGTGGLPQLYPYLYSNDELDPNSPSYFFQFQDHNQYPDYKAVVFPSIRYAYWKRIAQQGKGYKGLYYFSYSGSNQFTKLGGSTAQPMSTWVNTVSNNLGPGVYFFDSVDNTTDPQQLIGAAHTNALTPPESWNASNFNHQFIMQGFIYMNAQSFGTTGGNHDGVQTNVNMPGEPFRDVGYPVWCTGAGTPLPLANCPAANQWSDCSGQPCRNGAGDAAFSCQDLQTGLPHSDGKCRIVVFPAPAWNSYDGATINSNASGTTYIPKTWKSNAQAIAEYGAACVAPPANWDGTQAAGNYCSEPHEPYLNLIYPQATGAVAPLANALASPNTPAPVKVGWEAPGSQTYIPKKLIDNSPFPPGTPVSCAQNGPNDPANCTSNNYDVDGALVGDLNLILYGILYDEGQYGGQGNVDYFGSVLIQDIVGATGTADVWFDEKLIKGTWAPPKMPRVIVFSEQTDEVQQ